MFFEVKIERDHDAGETTVTCESAMPDHGNFPRMPQEIVGLIKKNVTQASADDGAEKQIGKQLREIFEWSSFSLVNLNHDPVANDKTEREEEPVPANLDWTETKDRRIQIPN